MTSSRPSAWATGGSAYTGNSSRFCYSASTGLYSVDLLRSDGTRQTILYPVDSAIVLDWLSFEYNVVRFHPTFDDSYLVPYGREVRTPPDPENYVEALRIPTLLTRHGVLPWLVTSKITMNYLRSLYRQFEYCSEAAAGKLQICFLRPSKPVTIAARPNETYHAPVMEPKDWFDREVGLFGPVKVPPPLPVLPNSAPPVALPASPSQQPATDTYKPVAAQPTPAPAATPEPTRDDPLLAYLARLKTKKI